ncbi:MAG TPA: hypothetical protein PLG09_05995 [Syntrophomonadaceae bacterium]|nr:hypothetical protein [Syntrophomonadaceae bacterium]HOQ09659.1 hypothetical protein [Syntrophomonadaceae bacterium]HPU49180.1 hypothetical protein [Syntrophomonadaceae bacterium]
MKLRKVLGLILIIGLIAGMMIGCSQSGTGEQEKEQTPPPIEEPVNSDSIEATATYTGRIDNNSVEMVLQGDPQAFQLTDELIESWDSLGFAEGDQLKIQYQERENDRPLLLNAQKL